ncbi:dehydratase [Ureibacillus massiliensis 4400831 = CIP 108448 = CCUG 49529]|uniref:Dehydratase n=1 Tax=Ureibacillus massiliensis 4400831 = CIP 108448 = CCUG 49529 TaxID=1211035 RepID=A0A0A3JT09_9BACL|nr:MaoC/PaaZ C-terminal domain-containing protein [Ureibacillus massiliensis]KGR90157.1 dehydratase [Ureibacillus massiliensis 4400831 = CIP 108448 = CCUG 49529]
MEMYFDDFSIGDEMISPRRTVTETDMVQFAGLSGDYNPLHVDEVYAQQTPYKTRVAHGLLSVAVITGLQSQMGNVNGSTLGLLEINWKFKKGVIPGDTIYAKFVVRDKKETSKPDRGVLTRNVYVINQRDELVSEGEIVLLMKKSN